MVSNSNRPCALYVDGVWLRHNYNEDQIDISIFPGGRNRPLAVIYYLFWRARPLSFVLVSPDNKCQL